MRRGPLLALLAYSCLSLALFGRDVLGELGHAVEGFGPGPEYYGRDQSIYVWSLAHGARALTQLRDPFLTKDVFAPSGYNLAWATSLLGPALFTAPATLLLGAVASYNLLALAAPALAAWAAFLLCRELGGRAAPAFAGGLLFGFGSYESAEMVNHLNLALVALLPLAALLVLRRQNGRESRRRFIACLGILLSLQLWTSTEVFASLVLFGALAFLLGALFGRRSERRELQGTALDTLAALLLALAIASPLLYFAARYSNPVSGVSARDAGVDLANFVVPSAVTWLHPLGSAASRMSLRGNLTEQVAYFGLPLLVVIGGFAVEFRRSRLARMLLAFMLLAALLGLGANAYADGEPLRIALPWSLLGRLPLLRYATPGRFLVYAWLAAGLLLSTWLSRPSHATLRWGAFLIIALSLLPSLTGVRWSTPVDRPGLFAAASTSRAVIQDGETVLALPFGIAGDSMYWQVQDDFRFRLAGGYLSISLPASYRPYIHLIRAFEGGPLSVSAERQLCSFIRFTGTRVILLREHAPGPWGALLDPLGVAPRRLGGFYIYELPGAGASAPGACAR